MANSTDKIFAALLLSMLLSACSSTVKTPSGLTKLSGASAPVEEKADLSAPNSGPEKFNVAEDEIISSETLKAWRHALAHDNKAYGLTDAEWQAMRQRDEDESMGMLKPLALRYPKASFIKTMMGQVKQHFGKKAEAAEYYEESMLLNRHEPVMFFKAAEMRRASGNNQRALGYYKQVLEMQADFPGAKLGEARCLLQDKATAAEGRRMLQELLAKDPSDKDAATALAESENKKP